MIPRWVPYVIFGLVTIPIAIAAHLRGSITANDLALISVSLTVAIVVFSVYLSHRQAYLQDSRNADMQALRHAIDSQVPGASDAGRRIAGYFLILSEDYRRTARVRTYMSLILVYATVFFVLSLILSVSYPGSIYWIAPYFLGVYFFGCAIIARQQNLGFSGVVRAVDMLTPSGFAKGLSGSPAPTHLTFPPRYRLVMQQLERDGWGDFLRELEAAPDPNELTEPWKRT